MVGRILGLGERLTVTITAAQLGQRIDSALALALPTLSRSRIQSLVTQGAVELDGVKVKPSLRLKKVGLIAVTVPAAIAAEPMPEALALDIVYEDRALLVIDKPPGLVVHPGAGHSSGTLVNGLLHHIRDFGGVGGVLRPGIVHRLDKDTSGLLVVAKNDASLVSLQKQFKRRQVKKTYLAIVMGRPPTSGRFDTLYGRHPTQRTKFSGRVAAGKRAVTHFAVLSQGEHSALVQIELETGRTHQIRVHFSESGHPLLGEKLYRKAKVKETISFDRQALHAWKLEFAHPDSGKTISFESPVPTDFREAIRDLGLLTSVLKVRAGSKRSKQSNSK